MAIVADQMEPKAAGEGLSSRVRPRGLRRRLTLRNVLFVAFLMIAIIPVGILALWLGRTAYEKELTEVSERHLLIARNLSHALNRYSQDSESVFQKAISEMEAGTQDESMYRLLTTMGFRHACIMDRDGNITAAVAGSARGSAAMTIPGTPALWMLAESAGDNIAFSNVMANGAGEPSIYLVRHLPDGRIAVGELEMGYLVGLQKEISFGLKGHSAIVDASGHVLAHPKDIWRQQMKDLSGIHPVQQMMAGNTGVSTFFSPALEADMIAGFTTVPRTGWGVMVPQPLSELEAHANRLQLVAVYVGGVGLLIALVLAWVLSRQLASPIERIADVARAVRSGNHGARVRGVVATPREFGTLAAAFNLMLGDLERSGERLRQKAEEAEEANAAKGRFLANMSHEFRTPLGAIIGYSEIMKDELLGPLGSKGEYKDYSESMHRAGHHILQMVNEILLLTRAEAGHLELHPNPIRIEDPVHFAVSMLQHEAEAAGVTIDCEIQDDLPVIVTDDGKLRQMLLNLLSNAVKFTDKGGRIHVSAARCPDWALSISVTDNGIGIAPKDLEKVMQPFGQVQDAYSRNHGGTGLGLPLTRDLAELMGGAFEFRSSPGEGTRAIIRLPASPPEDRAVA